MDNKVPREGAEQSASPQAHTQSSSGLRLKKVPFNGLRLEPGKPTHPLVSGRPKKATQFL